MSLSDMRLPGMQQQPTLLNSCARAATAAEARYRIDRRGDWAPRASRIIALDEPAAGIVRRLSAHRWSGGHFLAFEAVVPVNGSGGDPDDATLRAPGGPAALLSDELSGADVVVMIATSQASPEAASVIGNSCAARGIMSAGLVAQGSGTADAVVSALRPNAMVLVILSDEGDVPEILTALRV
jgi:hypothetical protein